MMPPTTLNLFFVQCLLQPVNPRAWELFLARTRKRVRYAASPEKQKEASRAYARENPEKGNAAARARYADNPTKKLVANRSWTKENPSKWRNIRRDWQRRRRAEDAGHKILGNLRCRIYQAVRGLGKSETTRELLGMEIKEFKTYLQGQFRPGMTWENYGPVWHVDHIRPCASFDLTDPAQQRECFNWSNCQPLFAEDNLKKGANGG